MNGERFLARSAVEGCLIVGSRGKIMPKFLLQASYTAEGVKGLQKDTASGRRTAAKKAAEGLGGKLESIYYAFGEWDVVAIAEFPDNATASAMLLTMAASGMIRTKTTPLLTVEEIDAALKKTVTYRPPGK
jgi:uncharacterized protein with GYD domain